MSWKSSGRPGTNPRAAETLAQKGSPMNELLSTDPAIADEPLIVEIGDAVTLTEGQGQGSSEDKRRAYN